MNGTGQRSEASLQKQGVLSVLPGSPEQKVPTGLVWFGGQNRGTEGRSRKRTKSRRYLKLSFTGEIPLVFL